MNPQNKTRELQHPITYHVSRRFVKRNTIFTWDATECKVRKKKPRMERG